jgi:hypothetical protein
VGKGFAELGPIYAGRLLGSVSSARAADRKQNRDLPIAASKPKKGRSVLLPFWINLPRAVYLSRLNTGTYVTKSGMESSLVTLF